MARIRKLGPVLSILVGLVIIAFPAILAWAVGLYLLVMGILELADK